VAFFHRFQRAALSGEKRFGSNRRPGTGLESNREKRPGSGCVDLVVVIAPDLFTESLRPAPGGIPFENHPNPFPEEKKEESVPGYLFEPNRCAQGV
jgi:hypothetical protein